MMMRNAGLTLALLSCLLLLGCGSVSGGRSYGRRGYNSGGYYSGGYGPGPYWGWGGGGGTVIVDRPIIIDSGPPVGLPLPDDIPDMGMPDFGDFDDIGDIGDIDF
jgi:hypothetical protein